MTYSNYTTTITVSQSPEKVYNAINNVSAWWQGEIKGSTDKINDEFEYRMKEVHYSKQRIIELIPNEKVVWLVTDSKLNFVQHKTEWTNTKIMFEIKSIGNQTEIHFTHEGLNEGFECYNGCSNGWQKLIHQSLFSLITEGKGKDVFG